MLEGTRTVQKRMRVLPSRAGIYFVLAMALFPGIGYLRVRDKLTAALEDWACGARRRRRCGTCAAASARPR